MQACHTHGGRKHGSQQQTEPHVSRKRSVKFGKEKHALPCEAIPVIGGSFCQGGSSAQLQISSVLLDRSNGKGAQVFGVSLVPDTEDSKIEDSNFECASRLAKRKGVVEARNVRLGSRTDENATRQPHCYVRRQ